jgi:hypothetical protein
MLNLLSSGIFLILIKFPLDLSENLSQGNLYIVCIDIV